jgi:hypothetical protein
MNETVVIGIAKPALKASISAGQGEGCESGRSPGHGMISTKSPVRRTQALSLDLIEGLIRHSLHTQGFVARCRVRLHSGLFRLAPLALQKAIKSLSFQLLQATRDRMFTLGCLECNSVFGEKELLCRLEFTP